jgi:hypothetical protein
MPSSANLSLKRFILLGIGVTIGFSFPAAVLLGMIYRFPIPFGGYVHGYEHAFMFLLSVLFYGILGGFILLALGGATAGFVGYRIGKRNEKRTKKITILLSMLMAFLSALLLAMLDLIIGPW